MTQSSLGEEQLTEVVDILKLARITEQKAKELSDLATAIAYKSEKRLHETGQTVTQKRE